MGSTPNTNQNDNNENDNKPQRRPMVIPKQVIIDDKDIVDLPIPTSTGGKLPPQEQITMVTSMGFTTQQAVKGLQMCGNNVERAVEWVISNPNFDYDSVDIGESSGGNENIEIPPEGEINNSGSSNNNNTSTNNSNINPKTGKPKHHHMAKCDNCMKNIVGTRYKCHDCENYDLCENCEPKAFHFHDPDHIFLGYDTEYVPPVEDEPKEENDTINPNESEEEKKQRLLNKLNKQREQDEYNKQKEELRRRKENKEIRDQQEKWEMEKIKIQKEQEKREREEKERYQKQVEERMEELKKQRLQQFVTEKPNTVPIQPKKSETDYDSCTIQIKLTNGETLKNQFKTTATLADVHMWVSLNRTDGQRPFSICSTYPRKVYADHELRSVTLIDAKLVPRGALIISNK